MTAHTRPDEVCEECLRLFDPATGQIVEGWKDVKWVCGGPNLCAKCKGRIIDGLNGELAKAVTV